MISLLGLVVGCLTLLVSLVSLWVSLFKDKAKNAKTEIFSFIENVNYHEWEKEVKKNYGISSTREPKEQLNGFDGNRFFFNLIVGSSSNNYKKVFEAKQISKDMYFTKLFLENNLHILLKISKNKKLLKDRDFLNKIKVSYDFQILETCILQLKRENLNKLNVDISEADKIKDILILIRNVLQNHNER